MARATLFSVTLPFQKLLFSKPQRDIFTRGS